MALMHTAMEKGHSSCYLSYLMPYSPVPCFAWLWYAEPSIAVTWRCLGHVGYRHEHHRVRRVHAPTRLCLGLDLDLDLDPCHHSLSLAVVEHSDAVVA